MKIHEYQAKKLFSAVGIPVERSILCRSGEEAYLAYSQLASEAVMIKAQVLTGGRGKAGGIRRATTENEARVYADAILKMHIKDLQVDRVLVSECIDIASEFYLSYAIDRNRKSVILILSREGGMDIEEVARIAPHRIYRIWIDPLAGMPDYLARRAAFFLSEEMAVIKQLVSIIQNLYRLFVETDASLAEINPLVLDVDGEVLAIDAKMSFDDNALNRHPSVKTLFEPTDEEIVEQQAKKAGFSYVHLGGEIACLVNGAGLAMTTVDMIQLYGGTPANFLDIGGSSNARKVVQAMELLLHDQQVKVVLINIFGGITRCDDVARGLLLAFSQIQTEVPVIVRLSGTNEKEAHNLLYNAPFLLAETMQDAVKMAVALSLKTK